MSCLLGMTLRDFALIPAVDLRSNESLKGKENFSYFSARTLSQSGLRGLGSLARGSGHLKKVARSSVT